MRDLPTGTCQPVTSRFRLLAVIAQAAEDSLGHHHAACRIACPTFSVVPLQRPGGSTEPSFDADRNDHHCAGTPSRPSPTHTELASNEAGMMIRRRACTKDDVDRAGARADEAPSKGRPRRRPFLRLSAASWTPDAGVVTRYASISVCSVEQIAVPGHPAGGRPLPRDVVPSWSRCRLRSRGGAGASGDDEEAPAWYVSGGECRLLGAAFITPDVGGAALARAGSRFPT